MQKKERKDVANKHQMNVYVYQSSRCPVERLCTFKIYVHDSLCLSNHAPDHYKDA